MTCNIFSRYPFGFLFCLIFFYSVLVAAHQYNWEPNPKHCNSHGDYRNGKCHCNSAFEGNNCEILIDTKSFSPDEFNTRKHDKYAKTICKNKLSMSGKNTDKNVIDSINIISKEIDFSSYENNPKKTIYFLDQCFGCGGYFKTWENLLKKKLQNKYFLVGGDISSGAIKEFNSKEDNYIFPTYHIDSRDISFFPNSTFFLIQAGFCFNNLLQGDPNAICPIISQVFDKLENGGYFWIFTYYESLFDKVERVCAGGRGMPNRIFERLDSHCKNYDFPPHSVQYFNERKYFGFDHYCPASNGMKSVLVRKLPRSNQSNNKDLSLLKDKLNHLDNLIKQESVNDKQNFIISSRKIIQEKFSADPILNLQPKPKNKVISRSGTIKNHQFEFHIKRETTYCDLMIYKISANSTKEEKKFLIPRLANFCPFNLSSQIYDSYFIKFPSIEQIENEQNQLLSKDCWFTNKNIFKHSTVPRHQKKVEKFEKQGVRCMPTSGSALGVFRNGGTIPGDTDVDMYCPAFLNTHFLSETQKQKCKFLTPNLPVVEYILQPNQAPKQPLRINQFAKNSLKFCDLTITEWVKIIQTKTNNILSNPTQFTAARATGSDDSSITFFSNLYWNPTSDMCLCHYGSTKMVCQHQFSKQLIFSYGEDYLKPDYE